MPKPEGWTKGKTYILGDTYINTLEGKRQPYFPTIDYASTPTNGICIRAEWSGKYRCPLKGEWYLSGCEGYVRAYRAPNDLTCEYFIMTIVEVKIKTIKTETTIRTLPN